jgi:hypothetical protein
MSSTRPEGIEQNIFLINQCHLRVNTSQLHDYVYFDEFQSCKRRTPKNELQLQKLHRVGNSGVEVFGWFCSAPLEFCSRTMPNTPLINMVVSITVLPIRCQGAVVEGDLGHDHPGSSRSTWTFLSSQLRTLCPHKNQDCTMSI